MHIYIKQLSIDLLDLRLNILDKFVDQFVIVESSYTHSGKEKKLIFDINKYSKFKALLLIKLDLDITMEIVRVRLHAEVNYELFCIDILNMCILPINVRDKNNE